LIAKPEPGELDHRCSGAWVARTADAAIAVEVAALVGHRGDADVAGKLTAVSECAAEDLASKHRREVVADTPDAAQVSDLAVHRLLGLGSAGQVTFCINLTDEGQDEHELPAKAINSACRRRGMARPSPVRRLAMSRSQERSDGRPRTR